MSVTIIKKPVASGKIHLSTFESLYKPGVGTQRHYTFTDAVKLFTTFAQTDNKHSASMYSGAVYRADKAQSISLYVSAFHLLIGLIRKQRWGVFGRIILEQFCEAIIQAVIIIQAGSYHALELFITPFAACT